MKADKLGFLAHAMNEANVRKIEDAALGENQEKTDILPASCVIR